MQDFKIFRISNFFAFKFEYYKWNYLFKRNYLRNISEQSIQVTIRATRLIPNLTNVCNENEKWKNFNYVLSTFKNFYKNQLLPLIQYQYPKSLYHKTNVPAQLISSSQLYLTHITMWKLHFNKDWWEDEVRLRRQNGK